MSGNQSNDGLFEVPIHASLWKSVLLAGADRRITIIIMGSCMVLVLLSRFSFWPCVVAIALATLGQLIGVKVATIDPHLIDVYLRHIGFRRAYVARPDILSPFRKPRPSIPKV